MDNSHETGSAISATASVPPNLKEPELQTAPEEPSKSNAGDPGIDLSQPVLNDHDSALGLTPEVPHNAEVPEVPDDREAVGDGDSAFGDDDGSTNYTRSISSSILNYEYALLH